MYIEYISYLCHNIVFFTTYKNCQEWRKIFISILKLSWSLTGDWIRIISIASSLNNQDDQFIKWMKGMISHINAMSCDFFGLGLSPKCSEINFLSWIKDIRFKRLTFMFWSSLPFNILQKTYISITVTITY